VLYDVVISIDGTEGPECFKTFFRRQGLQSATIVAAPVSTLRNQRTCMLTQNPLFQQLRPLVHPMLVHFPIALLFASVALDWLGYWLQHPNLTRTGFYRLTLGALGTGVAALSGPDHATGDPSVPFLLA
jgi:hypothetical protein